MEESEKTISLEFSQNPLSPESRLWELSISDGVRLRRVERLRSEEGNVRRIRRLVDSKTSTYIRWQNIAIYLHLWFSGKIGHCHCLAPGSIPGECIFCFGSLRFLFAKLSLFLLLIFTSCTWSGLIWASTYISLCLISSDWRNNSSMKAGKKDAKTTISEYEEYPG